MTPSRPPRRAAEVALVADDPGLLRALARESRPLRVWRSAPGEWRRRPPALPAGLRLAVLDLDALPEPAAILRSLRSCPRTAALAVVALGSSRRGGDVIAALRAGAAEHVAKPVNARVLAARLKALLGALSRARRRPCAEPAGALGGRLVVDRGGGACLVDGREVALSPKEFRILDAIASRGDRVVGKGEILAKVWDLAARSTSPALELDQYVARLRRKVPILREGLVTVRGVGYRLLPAARK